MTGDRNKKAFKAALNKSVRCCKEPGKGFAGYGILFIIGIVLIGFGMKRVASSSEDKRTPQVLAWENAILDYEENVLPLLKESTMKMKIVGRTPSTSDPPTTSDITVREMQVDSTVNKLDDKHKDLDRLYGYSSVAWELPIDTVFQPLRFSQYSSPWKTVDFEFRMSWENNSVIFDTTDTLNGLRVEVEKVDGNGQHPFLMYYVCLTVGMKDDNMGWEIRSDGCGFPVPDTSSSEGNTFRDDVFGRVTFKNTTGYSKSEIPGVLESVFIRHENDPTVVAARMTDGTLDFGPTPMEEFIGGLVMLHIGLICVFGLFGGFGLLFIRSKMEQPLEHQDTAVDGQEEALAKTFEDEEEDDDEFGVAEPKLQLALDRANAAKAKDNVGGEWVPFPLRTSTEEIARKLGVGNALYLEWLQWSFFAFFVGLMINLPAIVANARGDRIERVAGSDQVDWTTQTSLGNYNPNGIASAYPHVIAHLLFCLTYLITTVLLIKTQEKKAERYDAEGITVDDYSLWCHGIPKDALNVEEWYQFFSTWGEVARVATCINCGEELVLRKLIRRLKKKSLRLKVKDKSDPKLDAKLKAAEDALAIAVKKDHVARRVIVTFQYEKDCSTCLKETSKKYFVPQKCRFRDKVIQIRSQRSPAPSDIIYENIEYTGTQRRFRDFIQTILACVCLLISFLILYALYGERDPCAKEGLQGAECERAKTAQSNDDNGVIQALIGVLITVINKALHVILNKLAAWTKPHTRTGLEDELLLKLFVALFVNTGFILYFFDTKITEVTWFTGTGRQIMSILVADFITSNVTRFVDPARLVKRYFLAPRALIQEEMDDYVRPPEWRLAERYGPLLKTQFMALLYAPMLPISHAFVAGAMLLALVVDKYNMLRTCSRPAEFGDKVGELSGRIQMYGVIFSGIMAVFIFSRSDVGTGIPNPVATGTAWSIVAYGVLALIYYFSGEIKQFLHRGESDWQSDQGTQGKRYDSIPGIGAYTPPKLPGYEVPQVYIAGESV